MRIMIIGDEQTDQYIALYVPEQYEAEADQLWEVIDQEMAQPKLIETDDQYSDFSFLGSLFGWLSGTLLPWLSNIGGRAAGVYSGWKAFRDSMRDKFGGGKFVYCQLFCQGKQTGKAYRIEQKGNGFEILSREWTGANPRINCEQLPPEIRSLIPYKCPPPVYGKVQPRTAGIMDIVNKYGLLVLMGLVITMFAMKRK